MWEKPSGEELLPDFMQATMNALRALLVYLGPSLLTAFLLLNQNGGPLTSLPIYYFHALYVLFTRQSLFYLIHLVLALAIRYFIQGARLGVRSALVTAAALDALAIFITYPAAVFFNLGVLKNILIYISTAPVLMTFFTLRIHRLRFSGAFTIAIFIGLLCWKFFAGNTV